MTDRTSSEMYQTARWMARRWFGRCGRAWRDNEQHWRGDRCCIGYMGSTGTRGVVVRGKDWWDAVGKFNAYCDREIHRPLGQPL